MTSAELRDHAEEVPGPRHRHRHMQSPRTAKRRRRRRLPMAEHGGVGQLHADARLQHGFSLRAVLAEFRALRAAILHRYEISGGSDLMQVRRFNEGVDEAMTESSRDMPGERTSSETSSRRSRPDLQSPRSHYDRCGALAVPEDNPHRRARVATRILNSAQRMQRMIGDMLDLTQEQVRRCDPADAGAPADLAAISAMRPFSSIGPATRCRSSQVGGARETWSGLWDADRLVPGRFQPPRQCRPAWGRTGDHF